MPLRVHSSDKTPDHLGDVGPSGANGDRHHLLSLARRISGGDHDAFADLYDRLSAIVRHKLQSTMPDPIHAAAVVSGTFVEVWWLARFHTSDETDVRAWVVEVAERRAGERSRLIAGDLPGGVASDKREPGGGPARWTALADAYDRQTDLLLAALLGHRRRATE